MASEVGRTSPGASVGRWRFLLLLLLSVFFILIGAAFWLAGTNQGTRASFYLISLMTSERIQATDVRGSLISSLHIGHLQLRWTDGQISISNLRLDWQPRLLKDRLVHIDALRIKDLSLRIASTTDKQPLREPASLALPLPFLVDHFAIDRLQILKADQSPVTVENMALQWRFEKQSHALILHSVHLPRLAEQPIALDLTAKLMLQAVAPFIVAGDIQLQGKHQNGHLAGATKVVGVISDMRLESELRLFRQPSRKVSKSQPNKQPSGQLRSHLRLRAFSTQVIDSGFADMSQLDLSGIHADWPATKINAQITLNDAQKGAFIFNNTLAGSWNKGYLPVTQASGRFVWDGDRLTMDELSINQRTITGNLKKQDQQWEASLKVQQLNLKTIDSRLRSTRLNGEVQLSRNSGQNKLLLALTEPVANRPLHIRAEASLRESVLTLDRAQLSLGDGIATVSGQIRLSGSRQFNAHARIQSLRLPDLGRWAELPDVMLTGRFDINGRQQPDREMNLQFSIEDSRIGRHAFNGEGRLQLNSRSLSVQVLRLRAGDNWLQAQGNLNQNHSDLQFTLGAMNLSQLSPSFGGQLEMKASVSGTRVQPVISARWKIHALQLPGQWSVQDGRGQVHLSLAGSAPLLLQAGLRNAVIAGTPVSSLNVEAHGQAEAHKVSIRLVTADTRLQLAARGGLDAMTIDGTWRGQVVQASVEGKISAALDKSATLEWSCRHLHLRDLRLSGNIGQLVIDELRHNPILTRSRGRIERLHLGRLAAAAKWRSVASSDLQLDGTWDLSAPHQDPLRTEGMISLQRTSGDLRIAGTRTMALQLQQLEAKAQLTAGRLSIWLDARGQQLGSLRFAGGTQLRSDSLLPDVTAPMDGVLTASLPAVGFLGPLISPGIMTAGRLDTRVTVTGSFYAPVLAGTISGEQLQLRWIDKGLHLTEGMFHADFKENVLQVRELSFAGRRDDAGRVAISGPIQFHEGTPVSDLHWNAAQFSPFNRTDRQLVLTGSGRLQTRARHVRLIGELMVDRGFVDLGREEMPALSDDVIVLRAPPASTPGLGMEIDMGIGLGNQFSVRGRGVNARLSGNLRVSSQAGEIPSARGLIQVNRGTYTAYGRELTIERGVLRFDGPPGNPALDIRAMRRGTEVEAGVMVTGTALAPRIRLVSEPQVPDAEKISWLVLGQSMSRTTDKQAGVLQQAAASLLTQSAAAGIQSQIAGSLGVDSITLSRRPDNLEQRIITLGKRVSSRLYVSYQQGLQAAGSVILLRYTLSPRLTVEAETGTRSVFSLFYNFSFD